MFSRILLLPRNIIPKHRSTAYSTLQTFFNMAKGGSKEHDPYTPKKGGELPMGHANYSANYSRVKDPRVHGNVGTKIDVTVDIADRSELYRLDDGENKVDVEPETRA